MGFGMEGEGWGWEMNRMVWYGVQKSWEVRSELEGGNLVALFLRDREGGSY